MFRSYAQLPRAIHVLCVGTLINRAGTLFVPFLSLYLTTVVHSSNQVASLAMGFFGIGSILGALTGGHLADHVGRGRVMLGALVGSATLMVCFSFIHTVWLLLPLTLILALVADMYRPAASALIADLTSPHLRPAAYNLMYVAINLGFAVGASAGGWVAERDYKLLFYIDALTSLIFAGVLLTFIRKALGLVPDKQGAAVNSAVEPGSSREAQRVPLSEVARRIVRHRTFVIFCISIHLNALAFMQSMSTMPLYMKQLGYSPTQYGRVAAINGVLIVVGQLPLTVALQRFHRGWTVAIGAGLTALGFGLMEWAQSLWALAGTVVVWTAGEMFMAVFNAAIVSDLAPMELRARYMGAWSMSFASAMAIGAPLGGLVLDTSWLGGRALWRLVFLVAAISMLLLVAIRKELTAPTGRSVAAM